MIDWESVKRDGWPLKDPGQPKILAIDGGGIRGIFPARYLANLEKETGRQAYEIFDLMVGTSTGGIIVLALGAGIRAAEVVDLYRKNARAIFKRSSLARLVGRIPKVGGLAQLGIFSPKYDNGELMRLLKETFGVLKMKDSKTMLCVPSVEHHKASPTVYKTPHHPELYRDAECFMWEVALATSAAPTYFPPYIKGRECKIDGGLWANSPILVGIAEAVKNGFDVRTIRVLSLGTGEMIYEGRPCVAKGSSLLSYLCGGGFKMALALQMQSALNIGKYMLGDNLVRTTFEPVRRLEMDSVAEDDIEMMIQEADMAFQRTFRTGPNVEIHFVLSEGSSSLKLHLILSSNTG